MHLRETESDINTPRKKAHYGYETGLHSRNEDCAHTGDEDQSIKYKKTIASTNWLPRAYNQTKRSIIIFKRWIYNLYISQDVDVWAYKFKP